MHTGTTALSACWGLCSACNTYSYTCRVSSYPADGHVAKASCASSALDDSLCFGRPYCTLQLRYRCYCQREAVFQTTRGHTHQWGSLGGQRCQCPAVSSEAHWNRASEVRRPPLPMSMSPWSISCNRSVGCNTAHGIHKMSIIREQPWV